MSKVPQRVMGWLSKLLAFGRCAVFLDGTNSESERAASSTHVPPAQPQFSRPAHKTRWPLVLPPSSSYLPSLDDWAQDSGSSILISCIAQGGLVGVWLSFGDATGAIFACFLTLCVAFFIDAAVGNDGGLRKKMNFDDWRTRKLVRSVVLMCLVCRLL
jgi:hypothetical protein